MFEPRILNFETELHKADKKSIIIGNGFGISFDQAFGSKCFSWNHLLDLCEIEEGSPLHVLLQQCNLDFELAHQKLNNAIDVFVKYGEHEDKIRFYQQQIELLREQLVVAVSASHPNSFANAIPETDAKIESGRRFLRQFDEIYSLNYDLLLYWLRCYKQSYIGSDSFRKSNELEDLVFYPDDNSNFLFPHGALFLNRNGISATKVRSSQYDPILAVVKRNIDNGLFPITVSEGTGKQKREVIRGNNYLSYCYDRLQKVEGSVFTFGCSFMNGKDEHIIQQLLRSPAEKIVIGEYAPDRARIIQLLNEFEQVQKKQGNRRQVPVFIADTSDTGVWKT
ncbi:DUF4917 family protein [Vibrio metschnikovii]|uniref:DUF4917 family protein n=1 Tax=Vibrio metschnikovii TaxID=28172 RepID=UPI002A173429|nr:DUF4917 family protein [Vibrio metschnikovii]EKO3698701.1 DUF4917 family protein [Vibrio metschnikovii]EKO3715608.1 DUF4917 family protein [Vibrio metschnikovii]EKO3757494.1 DUF4917 family protein [Vibrio metschnikovii]EKO3885263.1 DUF4917 family protein [Vibrio metschnikovii]